eukprot:1147965-Pelagomonas_calceolata.AAC.3
MMARERIRLGAMLMLVTQVASESLNQDPFAGFINAGILKCRTRKGSIKHAGNPFCSSGLLCGCRTVAFGNSYNDDERCVLAGYDNGDVKMFDLRMNKVSTMAAALHSKGS